MAESLLSILLIIPLAGAILVMLTPRNRPDVIRWTTLVITLVTLVASLPLYINFKSAVPGYQN